MVPTDRSANRTLEQRRRRRLDKRTNERRTNERTNDDHNDDDGQLQKDVRTVRTVRTQYYGTHNYCIGPLPEMQR